MTRPNERRLDDLEDTGLQDTTATGDEISRACDVSARIINVTASTLAVTVAAHEGKMVTLNRAGGQAVTLPAATGSGAKFSFYVGTTVTSDTTIKVTGNDTMSGMVSGLESFLTAADSDTITLNGTTSGGIVGTRIDLIDVAADKWSVTGYLNASGVEITPFSATVT